MTRIVAVADTHLYHGELDVPAGDVFVHAGDICRAGDVDELAEAARWIRTLPHPYKIVIAGNHDGVFQEAPERARAILGDEIVYLEDSGTFVAGLRVWGSPWQPEFNDWAFNLPRGAALAAKWAQIPEALDLLITHGPPVGIGDHGPVGGRHGCEDLRARLRIARPRLHLFGHIHQDGGLWEEDGTTFVNVTTWECERPPTVIDIDERGVRPHFVPPASRSL